MPSNIPEGLISETAFFDSKDLLTKLIPAVQEFEAVIVNKDDDYYGIVDSRTLYKSLQSMKLSKNATAEKFVIRVPRVTDSTSFDDVIYYFHKARSRALPYAKNGKVTGILKRPTIIKALLSLDKLTGIKVGDAMISPLIGVDVNSNINQAKSAMRNNKINRIAVLEGERLVGIITNYDLLGNITKPNERLPERKMNNATNIQVSSVMKKNPRTIDMNRGISDAAREMVENNISSLVVLKGGKPVGIITELDIITGAMATGGGTEANKIFISGLDSDTYQYEDEIRDMLKSFLVKIEKLNNMKVDYISVVVKKFKTKSYEINVRLSLGSNGIINTHMTGHIFDRTLAEVLGILEHDVKKIKERYLTVRKVLHNAHPEEELE